MSHQGEATEIERFKREISLVDYAATVGYTLDKKESSRSSVVMRREADDDKIIIGTSPQPLNRLIFLFLLPDPFQYPQTVKD